MHKKLTYSGTECNNYLYFSFDAEYFSTRQITEQLNIEPTSVMIKKNQCRNLQHGYIKLMPEMKLI